MWCILLVIFIVKIYYLIDNKERNLVQRNNEARTCNNCYKGKAVLDHLIVRL
jgi:hypothetical protein